jgi:sugar transferase (PEP-CTERM/EpsH1 system associated)
MGAVRKLLFLSHRIPYPPDKGDKIRAWHILRHLMRSNDVFVGCLVDDPADWAHVPALRARCADLACFPLNPRWQKLRALTRLRPGKPLTLDYFHSPRLRRWVLDTLQREEIDRIFVFCSAMVPYVIDATSARRVLDFIDADSSKWTEYAKRSRWPMKSVWAREGRTLLAFERRAARSFDHSLFVSEDELLHFRALAPESVGRTSFVSNGVDFRYFSPLRQFDDPFPAGAPRIVFTGAMDYRPNIDAVSWFARDIMPLLRDRGPPPSFWIVGANPAEEVRRLAALAGTHVTGRVPDTRPYLAHADVVVAPLRIARGIQNKILEAMAMGRPVVATPQAFQGIRAEPGHELLIADDAPSLARCVAEVLDGCHPTLGRDARRAVETRYDWSTTLAALDTVWQPERAAAQSGTARLPQPGVLT